MFRAGIPVLSLPPTHQATWASYLSLDPHFLKTSREREGGRCGGPPDALDGLSALTQETWHSHGGHEVTRPRLPAGDIVAVRTPDRQIEPN